jgi:hypothetical protein
MKKSSDFNEVWAAPQPPAYKELNASPCSATWQGVTYHVTLSFIHFDVRNSV